MSTMHAGKFTSNASRNPGREAVRLNGERHYINHRPHFSVHYYPAKASGGVEEVRYHEWEHDLIATGYHLQPLYDQLKSNSWETLAESVGPYDPTAARPYVKKIEHRMAL